MPKVYNMKDINCPADAIYVGRPTKWGNPFVIGKDGNRDEVMEKYKHYIIWRKHNPDDILSEQFDELKGRDLICWCAPKPCHADILLEIANG